MHRAVHRLEQIAVNLALLQQVRKLGTGTVLLGQFCDDVAVNQRRELLIAVIRIVPAGAIQTQPADVRSKDLEVSLPLQVLADEVLQLLAHNRALGLPKHQALAHRIVDDKQAKLWPEHSVIALLGLLQHLHVLLKLLLIEEGDAVDAGKLLASCIAAPVRSGDLHQFECLDLSGMRNVRPAAQVQKLALLVQRDALLALLHEVVDDLILEPLLLPVQAILGIGRGHIAADKRQLLLDDLLHLLFDLGQVFSLDAAGDLDIVVKAALNHRADRVLHAIAENPAQSLCHHVGS